MKIIRLSLLLFAVGIYSAYAQNETDSESSGFLPEGYTLTWQDEFNDKQNTLPGEEWWFETGNHGWGNN